MKLVCSDLDRTLLPNGEQQESPHARAILWHLLRTHKLLVAYVSGRDMDLVLEAIDEYELAVPDAIAADVGTSIYWREGDTWTFDESWQDVIGVDWNGFESETIQQMLAIVPSLEAQHADRQSRFKSSFFYPPEVNEAQLAAQVQQILKHQGVKTSLLFSHDPLTDEGLLDVVPQSATKREAVAHLARCSKFALSDVLFAGDSGNDVTALLAEHPGVLVANADKATVSEVQRHKVDMVDPANVYFARGELDIAGQVKLNGNYSAGIVEALLHYRPALKACLEDINWLAQARQ